MNMLPKNETHERNEHCKARISKHLSGPLADAVTQFAASNYLTSYVRNYGREDGIRKWLETTDLTSFLGGGVIDGSFGERLSTEDMQRYVDVVRLANPQIKPADILSRLAYLERNYSCVPIEEGILSEGYWAAYMNSAAPSGEFVTGIALAARAEFEVKQAGWLLGILGEDLNVLLAPVVAPDDAPDDAQGNLYAAGIIDLQAIDHATNSPMGTFRLHRDHAVVGGQMRLLYAPVGPAGKDHFRELLGVTVPFRVGTFMASDDDKTVLRTYLAKVALLGLVEQDTHIALDPAGAEEKALLLRSVYGESGAYPLAGFIEDLDVSAGQPGYWRAVAEGLEKHFSRIANQIGAAASEASEALTASRSSELTRKLPQGSQFSRKELEKLGFTFTAFTQGGWGYSFSNDAYSNGAGFGDGSSDRPYKYRTEDLVVHAANEVWSRIRHAISEAYALEADARKVAIEAQQELCENFTDVNL